MGSKVKDRKQAVISGFLGVDFTSSPTDVQANRASDAVNFILENGQLKKRNGWRQVADGVLIEKVYTEFEAINGIYSYQSDGRTELLVYAGTTFYRLWKGNESSTSEQMEYSGENAMSPTLTTTLANRKCQFFEANGLVYIVGCGDLLVYDPNAVTKVVKKIDPYIPTTTIDIHPGDDSVRGTLDAANILTDRRINLLVGAELPEEGATLKYQLDSTQIAVNNNPTLMINGELYESRTTKDGDSFYDGDSEVAALASNGVLTVKVGCAPKVEGENNISIEFSIVGRVKNERIKEALLNSRFGVLFGVGGNADRLFLSGSQTRKNVAFFSEIDNFAYFPDQFTAAYGTSDTAVTGFLRLSDHTLAVFKEPKGTAPTIYYQSGEYRTKYDDEGNVERITPVFSIVAGSSEQSAVNPFCTCSLFEDDLVFSGSGVYGIEVTKNVATDMRTARERSYPIARKLGEHHDFTGASMFAHNGRVYLSVEGVCYVADARYSYRRRESASTNYEWWFWDNIPAYTWAQVDGELWFGTADGKLCRFDEAYTDRTFELLEQGEISIEKEGINITISSDRLEGVKVGDVFRVKTTGVYVEWFSKGSVKAQNERFYLAEKGDITKVYDGTVVYLDGYPNGEADDGSVIKYDERPFVIKDVDFATGSFLLDGVYVPGQGGAVYNDFRMLLDVTDRDLFIKNVSESSICVGLYPTVAQEGVNENGQEEVCKFTTYKDAFVNVIGQFSHTENVRARWVTPVFDLGSIDYGKTLFKLSIAADPSCRGAVSFGYETRRNANSMTYQSANPFSLENFDFHNFSFDTGFWSSYSVKVKERNFNYIRFAFGSDTDGNCSVTTLSATYEICSQNMGVK